MNNFEQNYINPDNPLKNFDIDCGVFKECWVASTEKSDGICLNEKELIDFLLELPEPFGFGSLFHFIFIILFNL